MTTATKSSITITVEGESVTYELSAEDASELRDYFRRRHEHPDPNVTPLILQLDTEDAMTIHREILHRIDQRVAAGYPRDALGPQGASSLEGSVIAEAIRELEEYRSTHAKSDSQTV